MMIDTFDLLLAIAIILTSLFIIALIPLGGLIARMDTKEYWENKERK